jgi:hypothetical protein
MGFVRGGNVKRFVEGEDQAQVMLLSEYLDE